MLSTDRYIAIKNFGYLTSNLFQTFSTDKKIEFAEKAKTTFPNKEEYKLFISTIFYLFDRELIGILKKSNQIMVIADNLNVDSKIITRKNLEFRTYKTSALIENKVLHAPIDDRLNDKDELLTVLFGRQPQLEAEEKENCIINEKVKKFLK